MQTSLRSSLSLVAMVLSPVASLMAQRSTMAISPFVSFLPSAGAASPLAGLALTLGGTSGFAIRGSANIALSSTSNGPFAPNTRPWGADADAMFMLGGGGRGRASTNRSITPFAFVGIGTQTSNDVAGFSQTVHNWSYGAGAAVPIGGTVDLFGEGRWRMSDYVLPTARDAVSPTTELRFGVSFHIGSNSQDNSGRRRGRRLDQGGW
ncbi:MAG: hypothetical protein ABI442_07500 [Gemmatimonadaceae bacterium]